VCRHRHARTPARHDLMTQILVLERKLDKEYSQFSASFRHGAEGGEGEAAEACE
jgi:hypothetical protein